MRVYELAKVLSAYEDQNAHVIIQCEITHANAHPITDQVFVKVKGNFILFAQDGVDIWPEWDYEVEIND